MSNKFAIATAGLYVAAFFSLVIKAKTIFDAVWLIAIISIPASTVADIISRYISSLFFGGEKNVVIDLGLLLILGVIQYGLIGYSIGWLVQKLRS